MEAGNEDSSDQLDENKQEIDISSTRFEKYLTKDVKF